MATDTLHAPAVAAAPPAPVEGVARAPVTTARLPLPIVWLGALIGAVILLAFAPLLQLNAQQLWDRPQYQFFPIALLGSFLLAWSYWRTNALALTPSGSGLTVVGFAVAWALLAVAEVFLSPPLAAIAFLILVATLIHGVGGMPLFRTLLPAWAFLWVVVRPPLGLDGRLVVALQNVTSRWSSAVLDTLGVLHLPDGNVVEISGRRLLVEEACSGISSLFSLLACTLFLILWLRRPWPRSLLLVAAAVGWVLVANVLRIVTIAVVFDRWGQDLSLGIKHDLLGFGCFILAVLLIWSTDRLIQYVLPLRLADRVSPDAAQPVVSAKIGDALHGAARLLSWPMGVAFALLFLLHAATYGLVPVETSHDLLPGIAQLDEHTLPEQLAGWQRQRFYTETRENLSEYGEYSNVWVYKRDQRIALVSLDYPFPTFHMLSVCYVNQGWKLDKSSDFLGEKAEGEPSFYVEVKLTKAALRTGYLLYCECGQNGEFLEHDGNMFRSAWNRYDMAMTGWRHRLAHPAETAQTRGERQTAYQFQVFLEGNRPLSESERESAQRLFVEAVRSLRKELYPAP